MGHTTQGAQGPSSSESDSRTPVIARVVRVCAVVAVSVGLLGLAGWLLHVPILTSLGSDNIPIAPSTALAYCLLGGAMIADLQTSKSRARRWVAAAATVIVGAGCMQILVMNLMGRDPLLERWLLPAPGAFQRTVSGRMSPVTAGLLLLASVGLCLRLAATPHNPLALSASILLGRVVLVGGLVLVLGYLYGTPLLYGQTLIPVAITTALAAVSLGLALAIPEDLGRGPLSWVLGKSIRATLMRALLPVTLAIVLLHGLTMALIHPPFGNPAILSALMSAIFLTVTGLVISWVSRSVGDRLERAEALRRESEASYRRIVETTREGVWQTDPEQRLTYVNPQMADMLGYRPDELLGRRLSDLMLDEDLADHEVRQRERRQGLSSRYERRLRRKDGSILWTMVSGSPLFDADGCYTGSFSMVTDMTQRKAAEDALRASEARYRLLFELESDALLLIDNETGRILEANPAAQSLYGYARDELLAIRNVDLSAEPDKSRMAVANGETRVPMRWHRRKDGTLLPVEVTLKHFDWQGRPVHIAAVRDITERVRAEEALRAERDRAQRYLDVAGVMLVALDSQGKVSMVNRRACEILGRSQAELLGQDWFETCVSPSARPAVRSAFGDIMAGSPPAHEYYECPVATSTGEERLVAWHNTVLRDANGKVAGTLSSGQDMTERRRLEQQLAQAQKMEVVGRLAGGVAHDFNNLLTVINGYSEVLLETLGDTDPVRGEIEQILRSGQRAAELTRQLLAFSRRQMLQPTVLDLNDVVVGMGKMLGQLIGEDIRLGFLLAPGLGAVKADATQIEQVVLNLAVNARDAMPQGGTLTLRTANVELSHSTPAHARALEELQPGPYVVLSVHDTGVGMSAEVQRHLFEPFFTTKGVGKGTGLGLATIYGIVRQSGGDVVVESVEGYGSTFHVYLPRLAQQATEPEPEPTASRKGSETVLVVEDQEGVRTAAVRLLEHLGYRVLQAASAGHALDLIRGSRDRPDLVLRACEQIIRVSCHIP